MHDDAIRSFQRTEQQLRETSPAATHRFVDALKGWIRANLDWSIETGRYELGTDQTFTTISVGTPEIVVKV